MMETGSRWLQTSIPRAGARVRLFCFPHGGGGAQAYRSWPNELPDWIEVVAIQPPGRGARLREPVISDMKAMIREAAGAIRSAIDGPYAIFGHSVGALVAFEVARELQATGAASPIRVFLSGYAGPVAHDNADSAGPHLASDDELLSFLDDLGQSAIHSAMSDELREMVLTSVRADFQLAATHEVTATPQLSVPVSLLGGEDDSTVPPSALRAWTDYIGSAPDLQLFPGGHFYTQSCLDELARYIAPTLQGDLDRQPKSVIFGDREAYPLDTCLHELFREQAARSPERIALVDTDGRQMSYAELDRQSDLLARRCLAMGSGPDKLVAILMETSADFVVAYLAILKSAGAYLPIPVATPEAAIADILEFAEPVAVVATAPQKDRLPKNWQNDDRFIVVDKGWEEALSAMPLGRLEEAPQPTADNLAYCVMTSGTTGRPKGIVCPHRGAVNSYWWRYQHLPYSSDEKEACNVFFVWEVLRPLLQGKTAQVIPDDVIFDPRRLIDFLAERKSTRVLFTPSLLDQVLAAGGGSIAARLPHLRTVILNGEVVTRALAERFKKLLPGVALINDYSISECHDVATLDLTAETNLGDTRFLPVGRPMSNVSVYVLDEDLRAVPHGASGEVYVGGESIARGYLKQPDLTAARFLDDPYTAIPPSGGGRQPRMFRTGDVGRLTPDGLIEISGRSQFMIKLRGYSVVPSAVESEIRASPGISAALVTPILDPETGQPDHLVAYIAGSAGKPTQDDIAALRQHLKSRLPQYAIPSHFEPLEALPIDARTGKVDRRRLPEVSAQNRIKPAPESERTPATTLNQPTLETGLSGIWANVLKTATVNRNDNFFDLGGHSLLAAEMTRAAEAHFNLELAVIDVFDHPTLSSYAAHVASKLNGKPSRPGVQKSLHRQSQTPFGDIAVIGMAGRFPGAANLDELWKLIREGRSTLRTFADDELRAFGVPQGLIDNPDYIKTGAVLEDVGDFDPRFWGLSDAEATIMDPQQRLFLDVCWHALEAAGHRPEDASGNIGVFAGCYLPGYLIHHLGAGTHFDPADPTRFHLAEIGNDKDYLASRTAYLMNLTGPAIGVQTSCSTGLVAIAQAAAALRDGQCDMALAGASSITFPQGGFMSVDGHIGTRNGICRAFDANSDGTILGDGVAAVVLRRLDDALADGDEIHAVIKGYAVNNDGASKAGYSAPSAAGQAAVISRALEMAGVGAETVGYVESHGTGTRLGDPIEVRGLTQAFSPRVQEKPSCALGSIKPNIGHSNIAAGVAGFIKAVMCVREATIPPLANFENQNPELDLAVTPFFIPTEVRAWPQEAASSVDREAPRRAGVSSFGIGGTNAHIVIEEAPAEGRAPQQRNRPAAEPETPVILPLSAKTSASLQRMAGNLADHLRAHSDVPLSDIAATLQSGRKEFPERLAVAASTHEEAADALHRAALSIAVSSPARSKSQPATKPASAVFVFPGHGSSYPDMGSELYAASPQYRRHFDDCAAVFAALDGSLKCAISPSGNAKGDIRLKSPLGLQASIFSIEVALARTLIDLGIQPAAVCGHSLGEYAAATIAGILSLKDAARIVAVRAQGTSKARPGAMLALKANHETVEDFLLAHPTLALAGVNTPSDCVVSGALEDVAVAEQEAAHASIAARRIPVEYAFHSPLMTSAADDLEQACDGLVMQSPSIQMTANATGRWWTDDETNDAGYWARAMLSPVLFADNVRALLDLKPTAIIEVGPGHSLRRALQHCVDQVDIEYKACAADDTNPPAVISLLGGAENEPAKEPAALAVSLASLWQSGLDIDWESFREHRLFQRVALPGYAFERHRCWPADDQAQSGATASKPVTERETRVAFDEMFYLPSWARSLPPNAGQGWRGRVGILAPADGLVGGLKQQLANLLDTRGCDIIEIGCAADRQSHRAAATELISLLSEGQGALRVVDLSFVGESRPAPVASTAILAETFANLRSWPLRSGLDYWLVTSGAVEVAGENISPNLVPLIGPLLVAAQEDPRLRTRLIDIDRAALGHSASSNAAMIGEEVSTALPRSEPILACRGRHRWVERFEQLRLDDGSRQRGAAILKETSSPHVITGGLGRIGLALARHLASIGCKVVLLGRRQPPNRTEREKLFRDCADQITYQQCDVSDETGLHQTLGSIAEDHNGLGGIFHCAGLADLRYLQDTTTETIAAEAAPKIAGTDNLRNALNRIAEERAVRPSFVMLFSSLASILGGLGMTGYAAANRYLDAMVGANPMPDGVHWISVNFDDWDFDYTKEQVAAFTHTRQGLAIPVGQGLAAIEAILGEPAVHQIVLSATPLEPRIARWAMRSCGQLVAGHDVAPIYKAPFNGVAQRQKANNSNPTAALILKAYAKVIGSRDLELEADFFELGGDSLLAAQLALELRGSLPRGIDVSIGDIFDYPTPKLLAQRLDALCARPAGTELEAGAPHVTAPHKKTIREEPAG